MGSKANSGQYGYKIKKDGSFFQALIPLVAGGVRSQRFNSLSAARSWQHKELCKEWGARRVTLLKQGRLYMLRSTNVGVNVRMTTCVNRKDPSVHYERCSVDWRNNDGTKQSASFGPKNHGDLFEEHAHWFAAHQRARMSFSELRLPYFLSPESFDLQAAVHIKTAKN